MKQLTKNFFILLIGLLFLPFSTFAQPPGNGWGSPVFQDDFNGNSLNSSKWRVKNNNGNGAGEGQFKANMVSVANGILTIKNNLVSQGAAGRRGGWVDSKIKFGNGGAFPKYGYFEADVRINRQGINFNWIGGKIWPTWWLWEGGQGSYIPTEFDIMEYSRWTNFKANGNATSSHHYRNKAAIGSGPDPKKFAITDKNSPRDEFNWHKWGLLWTPTKVTWYYDGVPYGSSDRPGDAAQETVPLKLIFSSSPHVVTHPDTPPRFAPKVSDNLPSFQIRSVRVWQGGNPGGGNNGGGNNSGAPIGSTISLQGSNGKFVSSENGNGPINCNRNSAQGWERFTVVNAGNGKIALKGTNGKYISSENGNSAMTCSRSSLGAWEAFTWGTNNGKVTLKGNNGKFVSSENGTKPMNCNRNGVGAWERFTVNVLRVSDNLIEKPVNGKIEIFPNPTTGIFNINFNRVIKNVSTTLTDLSGRVVYKDMIKEGNTKTIDIQGLPRGVYILTIQGRDINVQNKLVIE